MSESRRLKELHDVIDAMLQEDSNASVDGLVSIYKDIYGIDNSVSNDAQKEIAEILHHAYCVNGGFEWEKTGPNTCSVYFYGRCRSEDGKRKCTRVDLKIGNRFAMILGYEIL